MSANMTLVQLEIARRTERTAKRRLRLATAFLLVCVTSFLVGLFLAAWSSIHHWDAGAAGVALILPGLFFGMGAVVLVALTASDAADAEKDVLVLEGRYADAYLQGGRG
jgi:formate-dependent nitrite reductase membrane component NrfD